MSYEVPQHIVSYLQKKFTEGRALLVLGAGFSRACVNSAGAPIPLGAEMAKMIWDLVLPGEAFDGSSLQDVFQMALRSRRKDLAALLEAQLSVDPKRVPPFYLAYYSLPWTKVYTLNIDNLPVVAQGSFKLPAPLTLVSSVPSSLDAKRRYGALDVVHLNGMLKDGPENLTFATLQYAERLTGHDPLYTQLVAEMQTCPTVFVGTVLNEPSLWQHVELRRTKGVRGAGEQRPRSFIVSPSLDKARQSLLRDFNVEWIPLDAEQFAAQVLSKILGSIPATKIVDIRHSMLVGEGKDVIPLVADLLASAGDAKTEYLRGQEPTWADVTKERMAARAVDGTLYTMAEGCLGAKQGGMILVTGTAGSGKSSSMMSLAAHLSNDGFRVGYCDRSLDVDLHELQKWPLSDCEGEQVLFIDDADRYGNALSGLIAALASGPSCLIVLAVRSSRVERVLSSTDEATYQTVAMPPLEDPDIIKLLDVLERNQHLGRLTGVDKPSRIAAMREQAGRQLLVAMIQATSGVRFEEKAAGEYEELTVEEKVIYSLAAVATHYGFEVRREEMLIAAGDYTNDVLNVIDRLKRRSLLVPTRSERPNDFRVRHREVARIVCERLCENQQAHVPIAGLARAMASHDLRRSMRSSRNWRFMKSLMNHATLPRMIPDLDDVRSVYESMEAVLSWDYHFWLQRGSLEVERGNIRDARQFLDTAKSLNAEDALVQTEYAYLQFRIAIETPRSPDAVGFVESAIATLEEQIEKRGAVDSYPFHVLGSQGLAWSRHGLLAKDQRRELLHRLVAIVEKGVRAHPFQKDLLGLRDDLKKEVLATAVPRSGS